MSFTRANELAFHYRLTGPVGARALVFINSLGTDARIWDDVIADLDDRYRILSYDKRGHGLSDVVAGPYQLDDHLDDLIGLADCLGIDKFGLVGVSVGGLIAQGAALRHRDRVRALVLCDTAAKIGNDAFWGERMAAVSAGGTASIADQIMERWFSAEFRLSHPEQLSGWRNMLMQTSSAGYVATCATLRDTDLTGEVAGIATPTLVVVGENDLSTPPALVRGTANLIPGARFEVIRNAGHIPSIEQPAVLARLITNFLKDIGYV